MSHPASVAGAPVESARRRPVRGATEGRLAVFNWGPGDDANARRKSSNWSRTEHLAVSAGTRQLFALLQVWAETSTIAQRGG